MSRATGIPLSAVMLMPADEFSLLYDHIKRNPPEYQIVPQLLAILLAMFARANWKGSQAMPEDFLPHQETAEQREDRKEREKSAQRRETASMVAAAWKALKKSNERKKADAGLRTG